ncbi:DUF2750 domain-containing protein [Hellea sp.]|nr:DUF2750 domain-containing protein [Hellea sp.]
MISEQQIKAVLNLNAAGRYNHFIKQVVDYEKVWGLYFDGWATSADNQEQKLIPVWPRREYALLHASDEWEGFEPKAISVNEFINTFIPELVKSNYGLSVFYVADVGGVDIEITQLLNDLEIEACKY